jgi:hypothetical protein
MTGDAYDVASALSGDFYASQRVRIAGNVGPVRNAGSTGEVVVDRPDQAKRYLVRVDANRPIQRWYSADELIPMSLEDE